MKTICCNKPFDFLPPTCLVAGEEELLMMMPSRKKKCCDRHCHCRLVDTQLVIQVSSVSYVLLLLDLIHVWVVMAMNDWLSVGYLLASVAQIAVK